MERGEFTLNRREELRQLSGEKLKAILQARRKGPEEVKISSEMVLCNISRQDNITDPSRSERRCENANAFYLDSGALPNQINSPMREQSRNQSFSEDRSDTYHLAQDKLFGCLQGTLSWEMN